MRTFSSINKGLHISSSLTSVLLSLALFVASVTDPFCVYGQQTYQMPPKAIADIIDAPPTPVVEVSPDKKWLLIMVRPSLPSIKELSQPEVRVAGLRINPKTNGPSRANYFIKLSLKAIFNGKEKIIPLPELARVSNCEWSPDGKYIAFTLTKENGIELWIAEASAGTARKLIENYLNASLSRPFSWLSDGKTLVCLIIPSDRGYAPQAPIVPTGPVIQENVGKKAPARTFQDLLKNPYDESLFDYYATSQLVRVSTDGQSISIGPAGIIASATPSPSGKYLLLEMVHKPYSYLVPIYNFPRRVEVWDLDGNVVHQVADLPLAEEVPAGFDAVPRGPRSFDWRADAPATLYWAEAQDGGDPRNEVSIRDKVFMLTEPFNGEPILFGSLGLRYNGINWGNETLALIYESWWKTRRTRTWIFQPGKLDQSPRLLFDRSSEDRYSDPGHPVLRQTAWGTLILRTMNQGNSIYLAGNGASPQGDRPFLDQLDLKKMKTKRLWQSGAPYFENFVTFLDQKGDQFLIRRESVSEPPNYFRTSLSNPVPKQLTFFPHPTPQLKEIQKEIITYYREDSVKLQATLYLPAGYVRERDGPLPMLMFVYPQEFKSVDAAGQMRGSPYQFVRIGATSHLLLLTQGYAILDGPTMPIIGVGDKEPNDTYVEQLVASARAAIDEVVRRGVADRDRMAIGGHSYGAFTTVNLLAHSDLFRAGIARSGAYNRTLTPFGFQAEERTLWQAPETYIKMSPFMHADKINEPLLLIHGEADDNSGTFPIQSERLYNALKGHGATARLVMLPYESHGYRARESVMHVMWEMLMWLDKNVNKAQAR